MSIMAAAGLTKTFGQGPAAVSAVDGGDLTVDAGEVVLLLGPSGSGKTTLLSMVGGLLRPTMGSVLIAGRALAGTPSDLARLRLGTIGFVFQTLNLLPGFSAIECRSFCSCSADEPTASLDTRTGRDAMEVLTSSARQGRQACLVVTHDTRLIDFADRVLKIEDGRILDS